jgi:histidine kinase
VGLDRQDEMGHLAMAINQMGSDIGKHQAELNRQRKEYQTLFERVPCLITVQDRNFRLLAFNHEFSARFAPNLGDYCFRAYKGRDKKCEPCPVEQTFADGQSHNTEESGINKDGTRSYWLVRTSPIRDAKGEIVAAMEISLDITERKNLEDELEVSEKKYHAIFSNIPNPVFVLEPETLVILDCNNSVPEVYGYRPDELVSHFFLDLFLEEEQDFYRCEIQKQKVLNQVRHRHQSGRDLFVNIRISPSQYSGRKVLLITTSDITKRLEAEQQLIQASKMATLGEMATGVAHELNQPLSVIKTTSSFFMRKLVNQEPIERQVLHSMLSKVDTNVDRATRIINHMRQFARKTDLELQKTHLNDVLHNAFEIFSQQLRVRGITVHWDLADDLPKIKADAQRLEQVFINLLINARDAIEEKWRRQGQEQQDDCICIQTRCIGRQVICRICDSGIGIPKEVRDKIFEPFYTTKEVGKGTGLGLSISYGIIKDCRGSIRAEPNEPQGACFVMHFEALNAADASPERNSSEPRLKGDFNCPQVEV